MAEQLVDRLEAVDKEIVRGQYLDFGGDAEYVPAEFAREQARELASTTQTRDDHYAEIQRGQRIINELKAERESALTRPTGRLQDELERARLHGPDVRTIDALTDAIRALTPAEQPDGATPETDIASYEYDNQRPGVSADFTRTLERQRNVALAELASANSLSADLASQRAELREALAKLREREGCVVVPREPIERILNNLRGKKNKVISPEHAIALVRELDRAMLAAPAPGAEASRDWPEDFSHENGRYQCRCVVCKEMFYGHKRRHTCKICGNDPNAATADLGAAAQDAEGWISVQDKLPQGDALVSWDNSDDVSMIFCDHGEWLCDTPYRITHWRLPPASAYRIPPAAGKGAG